MGLDGGFALEKYCSCLSYRLDEILKGYLGNVI